MGVKLSYRIKKGKNIPKKLTRLRNALRDRTKPMNELKTYAILRWRDNFESQGSIYGSWAGLSEWSWRRGHNHGGTPLMLTGALFMNVMSQSRQGKVNEHSVTWAFKNGPPSYPLSHQTGWNPYFEQPARIIWALNAEDEAHSHRVIDAWVSQQVRRIFG